MRSSQSVSGQPTALRNDCILYLTVLSARDLKETQKIGVQDPYCAVYLNSGGKEAAEPSFKTSTHDNGGTEPVWNEKGTILIPNICTDVLKIKVRNENWVGSNTIGKMMVSLQDLSRGRSMEKEFALMPQGFIKVLMYLSIGHENPTSQPRMKFGEYPQHFVIGKTKLFLGLISGEKLRDIQSFGTQDPYCEVFLSKRRNPSAQDLVYKSKTHNNGGKNPRWMEAITVGVRCIEHDFLVIRVMNDNHLKDDLIGEMCMKLELLVGKGFEDKNHPVEALDTIVGQVRLQLALFNDEVLDDDESDHDGDLDGCSCSNKTAKRATKVGDVLISGISPDGVQYLEAGTVVHTGCELAGDYVMDKFYWDGDEI
jgi:Ca2+-dependent lipid-binding protein